MLGRGKIKEAAMSQTSPNLELPLVMPDQAQKHVTVNESLLRLDALVQLSVESVSVIAQPASPEEGQAWILPDGATGADWTGWQAGTLAVFRDGTWFNLEPAEGWRAYIRDTGAMRVCCDSSSRRWIDQLENPVSVIAGDVTGAVTQALVLNDEITGLTGASVSSTIVIPDRSVVIGVTVRTSEAITGASSFDCGIASETSKFGGSLGVSAGASNIGVIGPQAFYADTPVLITANGGDFTGGSVRLAIHVLKPVAPD